MQDKEAGIILQSLEIDGCMYKHCFSGFQFLPNVSFLSASFPPPEFYSQGTSSIYIHCYIVILYTNANDVSGMKGCMFMLLCTTTSSVLGTACLSWGLSIYIPDVLHCKYSGRNNGRWSVKTVRKMKITDKTRHWHDLWKKRTGYLSEWHLISIYVVQASHTINI